MPCSKTCGFSCIAKRPDFTLNTANGDSIQNHRQATSPLKIVKHTAITSLAYKPNSSLTHSTFGRAYAKFMFFKKWSFYGHAH